jgi:hypothetical protein
MLRERTSWTFTGFDQAMRLLTHPASLTSIFLLLINDHWLKTHLASPLTGKLSDFAGLFFFPFLLIACLSFITDLFQLPNSWTGWFSFSFTGLVFLSFQISPNLSSAFEALWSNALNIRISITPDITDLIALLALIPSWLLWRSCPKDQTFDHPLWRFAVLGLAMTATLATSCPGYPELEQVAVEEGYVYLESWTVFVETGANVLDSRDRGPSWEEIAVSELPDSVANYFDQAPQLPKTVCTPSVPQHCFRITGAPRVEYSDDSGQSWETAWRFPSWRIGYLNRRTSGIGSCSGPEHQTNPMDIALYTDESGGMTLFVAMGNQGLIVRSPDGSWGHIDVPDIQPTSTRAEDLATAWEDVFYERVIFGLASITIWLAYHAMGWKLTLDGRGIHVTSRRLAWWVMQVVLLSLLPIYIYINTSNPIDTNLWLLYLSLAILVAGPILTWFLRITPPLPRLALNVSLLSFLTAGLLFIVPVCLSILWALGFIPLHIITVAINLLLYWLLLRFAVRSLRTYILQFSS